MRKLSSIIFDIDGVLLDSLSPHLLICRDLSREYGLQLSIPGAPAFREIVHSGVKISPMQYFFEAVGFPRPLAEKAFSKYKDEFMRTYAPKPFPQVNEMLSALRSAGFTLGIVTSNVRANVEAALGDTMKLFHPPCIFTMDETTGSHAKAELLSACAQRINTLPGEIIYVGDQPADRQAAQAASMQFLGVTYGWGISEQDTDFPTVNSVMEIADYILRNNQC